MSRTTRHGLPSATTPAGMERVTMLPAPITLFSPIDTPGMTMVWPPSQQSSPMVIGDASTIPAARAPASSG